MRFQTDVRSPREPTSHWIIAQLGAREHYAIPRSLLGAGERVQLITDCWNAQPTSRWVPARFRNRTHVDIPRDAVTPFSSSLLRFEALSRLLRRRGWPLIEARNNWFDERAAARVHRIAEGQPRGVLFAYSYAARRTLAAARQAGWKTLLGQIDPGPLEWQLVQARRREAGLAPEAEPSATYWDSWREECDLADAILVNSEWSREALHEQGIPRGKIRVVPLAYEGSGQDGDRSGTTGAAFTSARPLQVLFLGQVIVRKGILEILGAIDRLAGAPVVWTFAGGGEASLLEKLRQRPQVRVLGPVLRQEAGLHYRAADIFLLPTHSDGFAITQLEAAAHGLPIIASDRCGTVVQDGVNGVVLQSITAEAISEAVSSFLDNPRQLVDFRTEQQRLPIRKLADLAADLVRIGREIPGPDSASITKIHVDC